MSQETKKLLTITALLAVGLYVLWETLDALRSAEKRTRVAALTFWFLIGFAIGGFWMYKHLTCEGCQQRFSNVKRRLGLALIE